MPQSIFYHLNKKIELQKALQCYMNNLWNIKNVTSLCWKKWVMHMQYHIQRWIVTVLFLYNTLKLRYTLCIRLMLIIYLCHLPNCILHSFSRLKKATDFCFDVFSPLLWRYHVLRSTALFEFCPSSQCVQYNGVVHLVILPQPLLCYSWANYQDKNSSNQA